MVARKQVCFVTHNGDIGNFISALKVNEKNKAIALKDCHIVDTALQNGKFVTSRDDNARAAFLSISELRPLVRGIAWVNPVTDLEALEQTLHNRVNPKALPGFGRV
jgi:hypothetical protein